MQISYSTNINTHYSNTASITFLNEILRPSEWRHTNFFPSLTHSKWEKNDSISWSEWLPQGCLKRLICSLQQWYVQNDNRWMWLQRTSNNKGSRVFLRIYSPQNSVSGEFFCQKYTRWHLKVWKIYCFLQQYKMEKMKKHIIWTR